MNTVPFSSLGIVQQLFCISKKLVSCSVKPCFLNNLSAILNAQNGTRFRKYNFGRKKPFFRGVQTVQVQEKYKAQRQRQKGKGERKVPFPLKTRVSILLEVALQQAFQTTAMAGLILVLHRFAKTDHLYVFSFSKGVCEEYPFCL